MESKQIVKYKESFWSKIKNKFINLFKRTKNNYNNEEVQNISAKDNDIVQKNNMSKQEVMELYKKVKNKEVELESLDNESLYKILSLLEEELKLWDEKVTNQCKQIESHLDTARMYNKQIELIKKDA